MKIARGVVKLKKARRKVKKTKTKTNCEADYEVYGFLLRV